MSTNAPQIPLTEGVNTVRTDGVNLLVFGANQASSNTIPLSKLSTAPSPPPPKRQ